MKRKRLALLLAAALTVTSVDGTALVSGADFSSEPVEEAQTDEAAAVDENSEDSFSDDSSAETEETIEPEQQEAADESEADTAQPEELFQPDGELTEESGLEDGTTAQTDADELSIDGDADFSAGTDAAAFDSGSVIPDELTELTTDTDYDVTVDEDNPEAWFSFTAQEDGTYIFTSTSESGTDPKAYYYDNKDVTDKEDYTGYDDDGKGTSNDFKLRVQAQAGHTYYLCAQLYSSGDTGSFTVRLEKMAVPVSVEVNTDNISQTEFLAELEYFSLNRLKLTVQYGEGKESQELSFNNENSLSDSYGNQFTYKLRPVNDEYGYDYSPGESLSEGTYQLVIFCNGEQVAQDLDYTVKAVSEKQFPVIQAGSEIESPDYTTNWYEFTAPETTTYIFSPVNNLDVKEKVKNETEDGFRYSYDWVSTDYAGSNRRAVAMEKDHVYYLGFNGSIDKYDQDIDDTVSINQWSLNIEEKAQPSSITFSKKELTFVDGIETAYSWTTAGKLTIGYANGSEPYTLDITLGDGGRDRYGNRIVSKLVDSDGNEVSWYNDDYDEIYLQDGTYKLTYTIGEDDSALTTDEITVNVKKLSLDAFPQLTEGKNSVKVGDDSEEQKNWYGFNVEKDGIYDFTYDGIDDENDIYPNVSWRKINSDGELEYYDPDYDDVGRKFEAGQYLVYWEDYPGYDMTVNIKRLLSVTSVKIKSHTPEDLTFTEKIETPYLDSIQAEVTYENGTTEEVTIDSSSDSWQKGYRYDLYSKDEDGNYIEVYDTDNLPAGDYVYRVSVRGVYAEDIPVKVKSVAETDNQEIKSGTNNLKNQDKMVLKYTAPADGRYELETNVPITGFKVASGNGDVLVDCVIENYRTYADFEKDTDYYIFVTADEYCPELKVTVSPVTRPVSMETKALKKDYIAGIDYFNESDMETKIDSGNKKSRTVRGSDLVNGYYLHYKLTNDENETYYYYNPLTLGTWTVTPYLSASIQTGSAISAEMSKLPVTTDTITAKMLDLKSLPSLKADTWESVGNTGYQEKYYAFTAPEDGTYTYETEATGGGNLCFYTAGEQGYERNGYRVTLKKGETCLAAASSGADSKMKVVKSDIGSKEPTEALKSLELTDEMEKALTYTGEDIRCTFTPSEDGTYTIESSYLNASNLDTYVSLEYDGEGIASNDDDGDGLNFRLSWKLEKGKTYTYVVKAWSENGGDFKLSFHKQNIVKIKNIDIVPKDGVDPKNVTIFDDIEEYYDVKVTYENGKTEVSGWWEDHDSYGNYISKNRGADPDGMDKEPAYTVRISYHMPGESQNQVVEKKIAVKSALSLDALSEGKDYNVENGEKNYQFAPSADGEYILTLNEKNDDTNSIEIYSYKGKYYGWYGWSTMVKNYEGENSYSLHLKSGETYVIRVDGISGEKTDTFRIQKAKKTLKGLELVKAPEQTTCLPNDVNAISLKGLQVKALYTDGSTETITYGKPDSSGRYIHHGGVKWLEDGSCKAYANLGKYQVSFDLKAASWNDVKEVKMDEKTTLKASRGDMVTLKFVAKDTALYQIVVSGGYVLSNIKGADPADDCYYRNFCSLKEGKTYYIHVHASQENPVVTISHVGCQWEVTSSVEATCEKEGKITETCTVHGETKVTVKPALGHSWNKGEITKAATCKDEGVKTYTCTACGKTRTESIAKTNEHKWDGGKVTKAATCRDTGVKTYTCTVCGKNRTETIAKTTSHKFGKWVKVSDATISAPQKQKRTCSVCKKTETRNYGKKLTPTIKLNIKSLTLQQKQTAKVVKVTMAKGDAVKSWASDNKKVATVDKNGVIKAQKKNGTAKITVTLKSGKKATVTVKVQSKKVATTKISGLKSKVTLKKGQKLTLKPVLTPVTSQEKITYTTSKKAVAAVSSKGVITAKNKGTAKITVKSGKKSYVVTVTVK